MLQLFTTLFLLFAAVIGPLAVDYWFCDCVSGRGLAGSLAGALAVTGCSMWRSRRPRRNRRKFRGIIKRWLSWRQVRKAALSVRLVEVLR